MAQTGLEVSEAKGVALPSPPFARRSRGCHGLSPRTAAGFGSVSSRQNPTSDVTDEVLENSKTGGKIVLGRIVKLERCTQA